MSAPVDLARGLKWYEHSSCWERLRCLRKAHYEGPFSAAQSVLKTLSLLATRHSVDFPIFFNWCDSLEISLPSVDVCLENSYRGLKFFPHFRHFFPQLALLGQGHPENLHRGKIQTFTA